MADARPRASRDDVEQAIRALRAYYRQGRASLRESPQRGAHGGKSIAAQAKRLGWNETKARKARQFARMYTREQVSELCRLLREYRPHFGIAHLGVLVTVPDPQERARLQRWCVEGDRSKADLEAALKLRREDQRHGGRRRRVSRDPDHALVQLDAMIVTWLRWHAVAAEKPAGDGPGGSVLDGLSEAVRAGVRSATRAMRRLREAVSDELGRVRAGRRRAGRR